MNKLQKLKMIRWTMKKGLTEEEATVEVDEMIKAKSEKRTRPTIMDRLKAATGIETKLDVALNRVSSLESENADLKQQLSSFTSNEATSPLGLEKAAHAATKQNLQKALSDTEISAERVSALATDRLAEAGFPACDLPSPNASDTNVPEGVVGRERLKAAFNEKYPDGLK